MKRQDHGATAPGPGGYPVRSCRRPAPVRAWIVAATLLLSSGPAASADAPAGATTQGAAQPAAGTAAVGQNTEQQLGVHIRAVQLSAAGFMLDIRYRVLDAAKAAPLLNRKLAPYLQDSNGARLGVAASPKIGPLRSSRNGTIELDRDYSILFGNPGRYLRHGSKVALVIGEQKIENLTVE